MWPWTPKDTADLDSIQQLIKHANDSTLGHVAALKQDLAAVTAAREALESDVTVARSVLRPLCAAYDKRKSELMVDPRSGGGVEGAGGPTLAQQCLRSQGNVNTMLALGKKPKGCIDSCLASSEGLADGEKAAEVGTCVADGCWGKLKATRQLEDLMSGMRWGAKDQAARKHCHDTSQMRLQLEPPRGWDMPALPSGTGDKQAAALTEIKAQSVGFLDLAQLAYSTGTSGGAGFGRGKPGARSSRPACNGAVRRRRALDQWTQFL